MHYKLGCEEAKGLDHIMYEDDGVEAVKAVEAAMWTAKSAA